MSVRTYNPSVRVGNWNEDIQLEEDTLKNFIEKREKGELLYQKRTKLEKTLSKKVLGTLWKCLSEVLPMSIHNLRLHVEIRNLICGDSSSLELWIDPLIWSYDKGSSVDTLRQLKAPDKVDLSISRDGFVHFGDKVNIRCPAALDRTQYFAHIEPRDDSQLVVLPQINKILYSQKFEGPCAVSGSKNCSANLRSTFVIKSMDGTRDGDSLRYGQTFYLSTMDDEGGNLLLQSDRVTLHKTSNRSRHQEVSLVDHPSALTKWQILHKDPQFRIETEGCQVPANEKVIINHVHTNQNLCVEEEICVRTSFNTREYEITAHTTLDSHKAEKEQNHWMIVMGVPGDNIYPILDESPTGLESASS